MENITNVKRKRKLKSRPKNAKKINRKVEDDNLTLHILDNDCLLNLFDYLNLIEVLNVSELSDRLKTVSDIYCKRVKRFEWKNKYDNNLAVKIFPRIGKHLDVLVVHGISSHQSKYKNVISAIRNNCTNLKSVTLLNCFVDRLWLEWLSSLPNLESLTFCYSILNCSNLQGIATLKEFSLRSCSKLHKNMLNSVLDQNLNIEHVTFEHRSLPASHFNFASFSKMNNLQSLTLYIYPSTVRQLDSLLQINRLTKLTLNSNFRTLNIDEILTKLAVKGILQELEIYNMLITDATFAAIGKMKLHLLNIDAPKINDPELDITKMCSFLSIMSDLKSLTLALYDLELDLRFNDIISLIEQLECLEQLNIYHTHCPYRNPDYGSPIPIIIQQIQNAVRKSNRQKLSMFLPWLMTSVLFDRSGDIHEKVIDLEHLSLD